ncbi:MAG: hypothetical protein QXP70_04175 [Methanomassiliicoccales archaeon]
MPEEGDGVAHRLRREWVFDRGNTIIFGTVSGLATEVDRIREAINRYNPDVFALGIGEDEIAALRRWNGEEAEYSDYDIFYVRELSRFGQVSLPSPSYLYVIKVAERTGKPLHGIDLGEEEYTELYMKYVSPSSLFIDAIFRKRRYRRSLQGELEEVVMQLDRIAQHPNGIARLDQERERHMARGIKTLAERENKVLAVVNLERFPGVIREIELHGSTK